MDNDMLEAYLFEMNTLLEQIDELKKKVSNIFLFFSDWQKIIVENSLIK